MEWCNAEDTIITNRMKEWCRESTQKEDFNPCLSCEYYEYKKNEVYTKYEDVLYNMIVDYGQNDNCLTYCIYDDSERSLEYGGKQLPRKVYLTEEDYEKFKKQIVVKGIPYVKLIKKTGRIVSLDEFLKETIHKTTVKTVIKEFSFLEENTVRITTYDGGYSCKLNDEDYKKLKLFVQWFERFIIKEHHKNGNIGDLTYLDIRNEDYIYR